MVRACGPFTKNNERIQKFKETDNTKYIFQNALDKVSFQHDKAYGDFKDLARTTQSDKLSRDKAFKIASDPKYDGYAGQEKLGAQSCRAPIVYLK